MRCNIALLVLVAFTSIGLAGDNELLDKFKKQNEASRDKIRGQIKDAIDKAQAMEKDDPAGALALLQETRDWMLTKATLARREDRELVAPIWERIKALQVVLRVQRGEDMRVATSEFKEYLTKMNDEFATLRRELVPAGKDPPPGQPAYIVLINGKVAVGWLQEKPVYVVRITIDEQPHTLGPSTVAGVQTIDEFYLSDPARQRFEERTPLAFFITAVVVHPAASKPGFWAPAKAPPPPPGFFKRSLGVEGAAHFSRSAGALMAAWAGPNGVFPERARVLGNISASTATLLRDAAIELQIQEGFHKMSKEDQIRVRDLVVSFLDGRPRDDSLTGEEVVQVGDQIAREFPDRRADVVRFVLRMNRVLDTYTAVRKNG
jgi:hypothetical protein